VFDSAICVQAARRGRRFESALRGVHAPHGDRSRASRRRKLVARQRNVVTQAPRAMNRAVHGRVQRCGDCKRFGERVPSRRRDAGASGATSRQTGPPSARPSLFQLRNIRGDRRRARGFGVVPLSRHGLSGEAWCVPCMSMRAASAVAGLARRGDRFNGSDASNTGTTE
jgi:hypothetical protein